MSMPYVVSALHLNLFLAVDLRYHLLPIGTMPLLAREHSCKILAVPSVPGWSSIPGFPYSLRQVAGSTLKASLIISDPPLNHQHIT